MIWDPERLAWRSKIFSGWRSPTTTMHRIFPIQTMLQEYLKQIGFQLKFGFISCKTCKVNQKCKIMSTFTNRCEPKLTATAGGPIFFVSKLSNILKKLLNLNIQKIVVQNIWILKFLLVFSIRLCNKILHSMIINGRMCMLFIALYKRPLFNYNNYMITLIRTDNKSRLNIITILIETEEYFNALHKCYWRTRKSFELSTGKYQRQRHEQGDRIRSMLQW